MNRQMCKVGHFFDGDKYSECPYCNPKAESRGPITVMPQAEVAAMPQAPEDTGKTVSFYNAGKEEATIEPVVGWLVCIKGKDRGKSYRLKAGANLIGRSTDMDVAIKKDMSVSRVKHAVLVYDPRSGKFFATPGESRELFYVNDNLVLSSQPMEDGQILSLGATDLKLVAYCGPDFDWSTGDGR